MDAPDRIYKKTAQIQICSEAVFGVIFNMGKAVNKAGA
jgi:hypothetical protein